MAIASSAVAISSQSAARTKEAKLLHCKSVLDTYDAKTATVQEMRVYADCVITVHPAPMPVSQVVILQMVFVMALVGGSFAVYKSRGSSWDTWLHKCFLFFLGFIAVPVLVAFVTAILAGILWLFS